MPNSNQFIHAWQEARPLLDEWAAAAGVSPEGHTVVEEDGLFTCTAYGYDKSGTMRRNSIVITRKAA